MLVEDTGTILVNPVHPELNFKKISDADDGQFRALSSVTDGQITIELDGKSYIASVYISPFLSWKFIGLIEESEILAQSNKINHTKN